MHNPYPNRHPLASRHLSSKLRASFLVISALCLLPSTPILAHGGGLNAEGCHTNRKTGDYHCHGRGGVAAPAKVKRRISRPKTIIIERPVQILSAPATSVVSAAIAPSKLIKEIQIGLIDLDYGLESADGILGPKTSFAIMKFQEDEGLEIDGQPTEGLRDRINARVERQMTDDIDSQPDS